MSEQPETGHIRSTFHETSFRHDLSRNIQAAHLGNDLIDERLAHEATFDPGGENTGAKWFCQDQNIARFGSGIGDQSESLLPDEQHTGADDHCSGAGPVRGR